MPTAMHKNRDAVGVLSALDGWEYNGAARTWEFHGEAVAQLLAASIIELAKDKGWTEEELNDFSSGLWWLT